MEEHGTHTTGWIMGLAAVLLTTMLGGSFLYTWSADSSNTEEKHNWRERHERQHEQSIGELKSNQKEIAEKIDRRYDDTQRVLQEILVETLATKRAAESQNKRSTSKGTP